MREFEQFSFKVPSERIEILNYLQAKFRLHKGSKTEAFLQIFKDNIDSELAKNELKKEIEDLKAYKTYAKDFNSGYPAPPQISEKACKGLSHKKNGEPFCIDPTSPISSDARRHLNHEVCKFCKEERAKQPKEDEKKQEEEIKRFYEQKKREVHDLQKSVNETIKKQNSSKGFFTNADGTRIPY